ncbi:MAG: hypothetical protein WCK37_03470 [Candidatus Falkowbacteria bacterium]
MRKVIEFTRIFILPHWRQIIKGANRIYHETDNKLFKVTTNSKWTEEIIIIDPGTADDHIGHRTIMVKFKVSPQKDILEVVGGLPQKYLGVQFFKHEAAKRETKKAKKLIPSKTEFYYLLQRDLRAIGQIAFFLQLENTKTPYLKALCPPNNKALVMTNDNCFASKTQRYPGLKFKIFIPSKEDCESWGNDNWFLPVICYKEKRS